MFFFFSAILISLTFGSTTSRGVWGHCSFHLSPSTCRGKPLRGDGSLECLWEDGRGCFAGTLDDVRAYCTQFNDETACGYHTDHCEFRESQCLERLKKKEFKRSTPMITFDDTSSSCFELDISVCHGARDDNYRVCAWNSAAHQCQPLRNIKCSVWTNEQLCRNAYGSDSACKWEKDNDKCTETDKEDLESFEACRYQLKLYDCVQHSHCIWMGDFCEGMNAVDGKPHKVIDTSITTFSFIELCASITDQWTCIRSGCDYNLGTNLCSAGGDLLLAKAQPSAGILDNNHSSLIGIDGEKDRSITIWVIIAAGGLSGLLFALCFHNACCAKNYRRKKELMCYDISSHPHPEIYDDLMEDVHEPVKMDDLPPVPDTTNLEYV